MKLLKMVFAALAVAALVVEATMAVGRPAIKPAVSAQYYRLSNFSFRGASVLPYTMRNGRRYYLLAREVDGPDKNTYDAFGGAKDPDEYHPVVTAGRECSEETAGLLGSPDQMRQYIDADNHNTSVIVANLTKHFAVYITHFAPEKLDNFTKNFHQARAAARHFKYKEKDKLAWVPAHVLENAIAHAPRDKKGTLLPVTVMADVLHKHGRQQQPIRLRPVFVSCMQCHFNKGTAGKNTKIHFIS